MERKKKEEEEGVNVIDTIQRGDDSHGENLEMGKGKRRRRREREEEEEEEEDRQQARVVGEESWKGRGRKSFPFGLMGGAAVSLNLMDFLENPTLTVNLLCFTFPSRVPVGAFFFMDYS
ncbi:hypothetical protein ASPFODRAFT_706328 [Aspergillus luchuensis CBS 106.47]|uniref:Uncharacterized protein n=1 Tax=Aspergillus luchuensis (strain CBS 106.47) TaxID=1137211 RepID=A0A1M3TVW8_ASPLC|nr:hypothetical protein ASPFODRAFT_706328 [Aspergillus luchuensis CBS 106.47]